MRNLGVPVLVAVVVAGLVLAPVGGVSKPSPAADGGVAADKAAVQQGTSITFTRQQSDGRTVVIDRVRLARGGFVAISDLSGEGQEGDKVASVIGVSRYLSAGVHENVTVTLSQPLNGTDLTQVVATAHRDANDNRVFDFVTSEGEVDQPYRRDGRTVSDTATLDLSGRPLPPRASFDLREQTARDTVVVRDVTLSAGGFVALVDEEGDVVGVSRYLQARTYETVSIDVVDRLEGRTNLTARAHLDTDGDRVFGFEISDGRVDVPYRAGDVTDSEIVRFTRDTGTSTSTSTSTGTQSTATRTSTPSTATPTSTGTPSTVTRTATPFNALDTDSGIDRVRRTAVETGPYSPTAELPSR